MLHAGGHASKTDHWKSGFYRLALAAKVPVGLGFIDYGHKQVGIERWIALTGDETKDLETLRAYYADKAGRFPKRPATSVFPFRSNGGYCGGLSAAWLLPARAWRRSLDLFPALLKLRLAFGLVFGRLLPPLGRLRFLCPLLLAFGSAAASSARCLALFLLLEFALRHFGFALGFPFASTSAPGVPRVRSRAGASDFALDHRLRAPFLGVDQAIVDQELLCSRRFASSANRASAASRI